MKKGFTLIELLVVMAIVATLLTIAAPRYYVSIDRSREAVLKENLFQLRDAIGKYHADEGKYPDSLQALATEQYLRKVPLDPVTQSDATWLAVPIPGTEAVAGVFDVRSGAQGKSVDVLLATAILTAGVGLAIEAWHTTLRRDKEADLQHAGVQYQRAIMLYYEGSPTGRPRYPRELKDLVRDDRYPTVRRYLRKVYPDPITGAEWAIMKAPDGGIMGVYSTSTGAPLKLRGAAATYADWKFAYQPAIAAPQKPAAAPKAIAPAAPQTR